MKFSDLSFHRYSLPISNGSLRQGCLIQLSAENNFSYGWGDLAPLPGRSQESLEEAMADLSKKRECFLQKEWNQSNWMERLESLQFFPSTEFAVESALLSLLSPLKDNSFVQTSALFMGRVEDIQRHADKRAKEGFTSAKIKIGHLQPEEAFVLLEQLRKLFFLRVDVNCAWSKEESASFFSSFPKGAFDYVEEPFSNPKEWKGFSHPVAVDESFSKNVFLDDLDGIPELKALIYKPTIQGGFRRLYPILLWAKERGIEIILSSSFESDIGLLHIASLARRLSLQSPIGIGTYHYLKDTVSKHSITFVGDKIEPFSRIFPK